MWLLILAIFLLSGTAYAAPSVEVSWDASIDDVGVAGYNVERCTEPALLDCPIAWTPIGNYTTLSMIDTAVSPTTRYIYHVRAFDAANNMSAFSDVVAVTTLQSTTASNVWPDNPTPAVITDPDNASVELGLRFKSSVAGRVLGVRFYKGPQNTGTHKVRMWGTTGNKLAEITVTNETPTGWQSMLFTTPKNVAAGATYTVSYHTNVGKYSVDQGYFNTPYVNANLTAVVGTYKYGSASYPNQIFANSNYWVDVIFTSP